MRTLVVGAGGTGGYFGGRMAEHGGEVRFLVRPARAARLAETGLVIRSRLGDAVIRDRFVTAAELDAPFDLVMLGCKAFDLEGAIGDIRPAMGPDTLLVPLLNGLAHLDRLDAAFGVDRVLGAVCYVSAAIAADGAIEQLNDAQDVIFGGRGAVAADRLEAVARALAVGRYRVRRSPAVRQEMWEKFVFIATIAAGTTLARGAIGPILATPSGAAVLTALFEESSAVAAADGHALRPKAIETTLRVIREQGSAFTASMLRDLLDGHRIESDAILGDLIRRADALGVPVPTLRAAALPLEMIAAEAQSV